MHVKKNILFAVLCEFDLTLQELPIVPNAYRIRLENFILSIIKKETENKSMNF